MDNIKKISKIINDKFGSSGSLGLWSSYDADEKIISISSKDKKDMKKVQQWIKKNLKDIKLEFTKSPNGMENLIIMFPRSWSNENNSIIGKIDFFLMYK
jgi:hypothetical protein